MKAFEKWDKKEYPLPPCYERGPIGRAMLAQRKHTWRAALKWTVKTSKELDEQDAPISMQEVIEQELEDR